MNKNYLMLLALVALGLSACRSDERTPSGGGYLAVRVAADNEVVSAASRRASLPTSLRLVRIP